MLLQFKRALSSVLHPYGGEGPYSNHSERVVTASRVGGRRFWVAPHTYRSGRVRCRLR